jgi:bacteriocin-like protein
MNTVNDPNKKENQPVQDINLDEIIDSSVEKAEIRKELSDNELDEISGGQIFHTGGYRKA